MSKGFYSLIQYCPDFGRAESANVGLAIIQFEPMATAVRIVADARPAIRRLRSKGHAEVVLDDIQSMAYRIEHEQFGSLEALEKFVRTRGNQIQLTMPRSMRIDAIGRDIGRMFAELVDTSVPAKQVTSEQAPPLLRAFTGFRSLAPERVVINHDFRVRNLGIPIHADYAYKNGRWNLVREMPGLKDIVALRSAAMGLSKEGELVRHLDEGEGSLIVVATSQARSEKAAEREQVFGEILEKLKGAAFVPSAKLSEFTERVETELGH
jgi:hypothetical protein